MAQLTGGQIVLDSWPILEFIKNREPAAGRFCDVLQRLVLSGATMEMTRINYGEVIYTIRKAPDIPDRLSAETLFLSVPIRLHSIDDALDNSAIDLKSHYPCSFADAFTAALAIRFGAPLLTGDVEFRRLEAGGLLELEWVGA
jgi:predicted nucleic acid-binding protein